MKKPSILLLSLALLMLLYSIPSPSLHATSPTVPLLGGWGGARLKDTVPNVTAPTSLVFTGQKMSNFEQETEKLASLGENTVRASFAPYCSVLYGLNAQYSSPSNFMGDYNATQLGTAISIAKSYNMYVVVDYHGYADFHNSTLVTCWHNFWSPVITQFKNTYSRIIWEPLNEPNNPNGGGSDAVQTAALSADYQNFLNLARSLGDTHWVVVQNLCSFGCGRFVEQYYLDYPTVNDTLGQVFESLHTYMDYNNTAFHTDCHGACMVWSNSTADTVARAYYLDFKNQTAWPNFSTEGGTSCGPTCPRVVTGSAGYSIVSFHFIQALINYEDTASLGRLLWVEAAWTDTPGAGVYGSLNPGQWGAKITFTPPDSITNISQNTTFTPSGQSFTVATAGWFNYNSTYEFSGVLTVTVNSISTTYLTNSTRLFSSAYFRVLLYGHVLDTSGSEVTAFVEFKPATASVTTYAAFRSADMLDFGVVNISDYSYVLNRYNYCSGNPNYAANADLMAAGCVTIGDLSVVNYWYSSKNYR